MTCKNCEKNNPLSYVVTLYSDNDNCLINASETTYREYQKTDYINKTKTNYIHIYLTLKTPTTIKKFMKNNIIKIEVGDKLYHKFEIKLNENQLFICL